MHAFPEQQQMGSGKEATRSLFCDSSQSHANAMLTLSFLLIVGFQMYIDFLKEAQHITLPMPQLKIFFIGLSNIRLI